MDKTELKFVKQCERKLREQMKGLSIASEAMHMRWENDPMHPTPEMNRLYLEAKTIDDAIYTLRDALKRLSNLAYKGKITGED